MLIIVEGPDLAGKTTFVSRLAEHLQDTYTGCVVETIHRSPPKRHVLEEYEHDLLHYAPGSGHHIICDRWHVGELIYGPLLRGESKLDPAMHLHVELFLQSRGAVMVYLDEDWATIERRHSWRGDDLVELKQLRSVHNAYGDYFDVHTPDYAYSSTPSALARVDSATIPMIVELAYQREGDASWLMRHEPTYVGPRYPGVLLVGDVRGPGADEEHPIYPSAFVPYTTTSGHYLFETLVPHARAGYQFGVMNACDEYTTIDSLNYFVPQIIKNDVVALGQNAHMMLRAASIRHGVVPHPQYVRRFHRHRWLRYHDAILKAAATQEDLSKW